MSVSTFVAKRYLRSSRENSYISWIATLSIVGIAIGIAAMIVVLSVINGFETELRNRFLAANAHILAYRFPTGITDFVRWEKLIKKDFGQHISGISPFVHQETMLRKDSIMHAVLIKGISPRKRHLVQNVEKIIRPFSALDILQKEEDVALKTGKKPEVPGIIIGIGLLNLVGAQIGIRLSLCHLLWMIPLGNFKSLRL
ncbi:MAG: ABC transporter permease [Bdellovibrionota bacterium]